MGVTSAIAVKKKKKKVLGIQINYLPKIYYEIYYARVLCRRNLI